MSLSPYRHQYKTVMGIEVMLLFAIVLSGVIAFNLGWLLPKGHIQTTLYQVGLLMSASCLAIGLAGAWFYYRALKVVNWPLARHITIYLLLTLLIPMLLVVQYDYLRRELKRQMQCTISAI
jgi:hypothetical protein